MPASVCFKRRGLRAFLSESVLDNVFDTEEIAIDIALDDLRTVSGKPHKVVTRRESTESDDPRER